MTEQREFCEGAEWQRKPRLRQTRRRWYNEITPFTFQKSHCQQCFQTRKLAEVIRRAWQQAAGALVGAPHLTSCIGAKRRPQDLQKMTVRLLSPKAAARASLGHAEAFTGGSTPESSILYLPLSQQFWNGTSFFSLVLECPLQKLTEIKSVGLTGQALPNN